MHAHPVQAATDEAAVRSNTTAVSNATFSLGGADHAGVPSTFQAAIASPEHITAALNFDAGAPTAVMTNAGTNTDDVRAEARHNGGPPAPGHPVR